MITFLTSHTPSQLVLQNETVLVYTVAWDVYLLWERAAENAKTTIMVHSTFANDDEQGIGCTYSLLFDWIRQLVVSSRQVQPLDQFKGSESAPPREPFSVYDRKILK